MSGRGRPCGTKYRCYVLQGEVQLRCRELIRQTCNALDVQILKGVVSKDHIDLHISYPPLLSVSDLAKRLKGRSAKLLLAEYPDRVTGAIEASVLDRAAPGT